MWYLADIHKPASNGQRLASWDKSEKSYDACNEWYIRGIPQPYIPSTYTYIDGLFDINAYIDGYIYGRGVYISYQTTGT